MLVILKHKSSRNTRDPFRISLADTLMTVYIEMNESSSEIHMGNQRKLFVVLGYFGVD